MDVKTLRAKTSEALETELKEARTHLKSLEFKIAANKIKNVREARKTKRAIARMETLRRQKRD